jgi:hypothetical protein
MRNLQPVTKESHGAKAWRRPKDFSFAAHEALVPLAAFEVPKTVLAMPGGFVEQASGFTLVGVLSPIPDQNLCVGPNGQWLGPYIPVSLRVYPFGLVQVAGTDQVMLAFDESSGLLTEPSATAVNFFDADGNPAPDTQQVLQFLGEIEKSRIAINSTIKLLAEADVIKPWPLAVQDGDKQIQTQGLFQVDEVKLNGINDELFLKLRRGGALALAYMQLLSTMNVQVLEQLRKFQARLAPPDRTAIPANLDEVFRLPTGDTIQIG